MSWLLEIYTSPLKRFMLENESQVVSAVIKNMMVIGETDGTWDGSFPDLVAGKKQAGNTIAGYYITCDGCVINFEAKKL